MFENLSEKLEKAFKVLKGQGSISEINVAQTMKEIRKAFLAADVDFKTAKQFTALMILDLSMKGKLNLDEDIRKYFPNLYKKVDDEIKIRHLVNHTSGIHEYVNLISQKDKVWWRQVGLDNDKIIELLEE